jgi:hypothetical protein
MLDLEDDYFNAEKENPFQDSKHEIKRSFILSGEIFKKHSDVGFKFG